MDTLRNTHVRGCDIFSVDGDHSRHGAFLDLLHSVNMVSRCAIGYIDDTNCIAEWCEEPSQALSMFLKREPGIQVLQRFSFNRKRGMTKFRYKC